MRIELSKNKEHVAKIDKLLLENQKKYGKRYCPCSVSRDSNHICPCTDFWESKELGECHCGKYVKVEL